MQLRNRMGYEWKSYAIKSATLAWGAQERGQLQVCWH